MVMELTRPYFEKRTYPSGPMYFVRTLCGVLVSRPLMGEALGLYLEQEAAWDTLMAEVA